MGALCSKSSSLSGGHTLIDSQSQSNVRAQAANSEERRVALAEAAERRRQSVSTVGSTKELMTREVPSLNCPASIQEQARGVNSSNPKSGQLSKQVERDAGLIGSCLHVGQAEAALHSAEM